MSGLSDLILEGQRRVCDLGYIDSVLAGFGLNLVDEGMIGGNLLQHRKVVQSDALHTRWRRRSRAIVRKGQLADNDRFDDMAIGKPGAYSLDNRRVQAWFIHFWVSYSGLSNAAQRMR